MMLQVAQPTVDEPRRPRRRPTGNVALVEDQHPQPAQRGVAGDARAIDPGADDDEIKLICSLLHVARQPVSSHVRGSCHV